MRIAANSELLLTVLLLSVRLGALLLLTPLFTVAGVPTRVRVLLVIGLALLLVPGLGLKPSIPLVSAGDVVLAATREFVVGAVMAFGLLAAFAAFQVGGRILDLQIGFGVATLIDPSTSNRAPLLGTVLNLTAVMVFFLLDGHHWVLRGLAVSLEQIPVGQGLSAFSIEPLVRQFGLMFSFGLMLVAPAVFAVLLLDGALAMAARTMPQVNMFIVSLPLKIFLGLLMLTVSLSYAGPLFGRIYESVFRYWEVTAR